MTAVPKVLVLSGDDRAELVARAQLVEFLHERRNQGAAMIADALIADGWVHYLTIGPEPPLTPPAPSDFPPLMGERHGR